MAGKEFYKICVGGKDQRTVDVVTSFDKCKSLCENDDNCKAITYYPDKYHCDKYSECSYWADSPVSWVPG